ncbi:hypothetical protein HDU96_001672 [Phlyctochytrium bullatum]|nr:hypothetical protein HDU96_001672 [Phlyctochytrium bullatum]
MQDPARRIKDAEAEIAELKAQLSKLVARIAQMEDQHAEKQSRMNELHLAEVESLTRSYTQETELLRTERDEFEKEISYLNHEIHLLKDRLEGVSATAAYVTDIASSLEDEKEANESELELYRVKVTAERQLLEKQLSDSLRREAAFERRVKDAEDELDRSRTEMAKMASLVDELKAENEDLRQRISQSRLRNFSLSSLLGTGTADEATLETVQL